MAIKNKCFKNNPGRFLFHNLTMSKPCYFELVKNNKSFSKRGHSNKLGKPSYFVQNYAFQLS